MPVDLDALRAYIEGWEPMAWSGMVLTLIREHEELLADYADAKDLNLARDVGARSMRERAAAIEPPWAFDGKIPLNIEAVMMEITPTPRQRAGYEYQCYLKGWQDCQAGIRALPLVEDEK